MGVTFWGCPGCGAWANSPSGMMTWSCNCTRVPVPMKPLFIQSEAASGNETRLFDCGDFMIRVSESWD